MQVYIAYKQLKSSKYEFFSKKKENINTYINIYMIHVCNIHIISNMEDHMSYEEKDNRGKTEFLVVYMYYCN